MPGGLRHRIHVVTAVGESVLLSGMRSSSPLSVYIAIDLTNLAAVQPFTRRQREDDTSVVDRGLVFRIQLQNFSFLPLPHGHNWYLLSPIGSLFTAIESTPSLSDEKVRFGPSKSHNC